MKCDFCGRDTECKASPTYPGHAFCRSRCAEEFGHDLKAKEMQDKPYPVHEYNDGFLGEIRRYTGGVER
jgi:hypothetical protein